MVACSFLSELVGSPSGVELYKLQLKIVKLFAVGKSRSLMEYMELGFIR